LPFKILCTDDTIPPYWPCHIKHCDVILVRSKLNQRGAIRQHVKCAVFRSTPLSRPNPICPSVRPSVHKKFLWFQWNLVCR